MGKGRGRETLITVFLTNDSTALILTPIVYALVTRLRLPALPFMFACTFIADTASFVLPVSNPINVIILQTLGGTFPDFLRHLLLPSAAAIVLNIALFLWLFRRDLAVSYDPRAWSVHPPGDSRLFAASSCILAVIAVAFVTGSILRIPLSLIALGGAGLMDCAAGGKSCGGRPLWRKRATSFFLST